MEKPLETENTFTNENANTENTQMIPQSMEEEPKLIQEVTGLSSHSDSVVKVRVRISETRTEVKVDENSGNRTLNEVNYSENRSEEDSNRVSNGSMNGHNQQAITDVVRRLMVGSTKT